MGLRPLRPREHASATHPASRWGWRWAECPGRACVPPTLEEPFGSQHVSAPSATGGSAGGLSRAAVPVGPGRTSPRSSSLEFRVSGAPCRARGEPGRTLPRGPECVSTRAPASPAFTAPTAGDPLPAFLGWQGSREETSSSSRGLPAPQSLSPPWAPLSPWPWGGSGHRRAVSPSWRVPGVKAAGGVRVVRPHGKAGDVDAFCPEDQHVTTSRNEVLQGAEPRATLGRIQVHGGRRDHGGALWAGGWGLNISEHQ